MRGSALLEELFQLARKQGLSIRREAMSRGSGTGGYCVLKGVPTVFVDDRVSIDAQIEVVAVVLRRLDWSNIFVHPSVRPVLGLTGDGDTPKKEGKEPAASNDDAAAASSGPLFADRTEASPPAEQASPPDAVSGDGEVGKKKKKRG